MDTFFQKWFLQDPMEYPFSILLLIALFVVLISVIHYLLKNRGLPPGPYGLPFLGYWPFLDNDKCHLQLGKLQEKYGEVFCFNYAGALYINMSNLKLIRELHISKADCFERVKDYGLFTQIFQDGVAFSNGEHWKAHRKFSVQKFKELGMTTIKENVSGPLYDCVRETVDFLKTKQGDPVDIIQLLADKCNDIIRKSLFGENGVTQQEVQEMNDLYTQMMSFMTVKNTLLFGNIPKYLIFPLKPGFRKAMEQTKAMEKILYDIVDRHKLKFDEEHPTGFIDAYFKERNVRRAKGDPTAKYFTDQALVNSLVQFVGDGVIAVAAFVAVFMKYTVENKQEQEKIYSELLEVVGPDRDPFIEDKNKLSYTNALILEILRTSDFFPLFPSQQCCKETTIRGYRIPVGAITLMNTYACHHDPNMYENPHEFDPSRFIPQDGKQRPELPITFGVGKRNCIGEGYVMNIVFLFLATIIKNFKLSLPPETTSRKNFDILVSGEMLFIATPRH